MANIMLMPKLGLTMVEGKIGKWLKQEGDLVLLEEPLLQVETDKIVSDVNATFEGTLLKIISERGDKTKVKEPICIIGEAGEDISELLVDNSGIAESNLEVTKVKKIEKKEKKEKNIKVEGDILASPLAKKLAKDKGYDLSKINGTGPNGRIVEKDILMYKGNVKATPTARVLANNLGVDINNINKSSRIVKQDVFNEYDKNSKLNGFDLIEEVVEMSQMRKIISERMFDSWQTSPAVTYELKVDTTMLKKFKNQISLKHKVTYTDLIVKIVSNALIEFPILNCSIDGDSIIMRNFTNIGVAVALDEGLIVPVVKYANLMGLGELSNKIKSLVIKSKNNELEMDELQGSTFTVTNLGMYEMNSFSPIINQPEVAILGITAIKDEVVVKDGQMVILPMMNLCLTADHRVVDGAIAAEFMSRLKEIIENPAQLLL